MTNTSVIEKQPKTSAPGQYLGYGLQPIRFCQQLLLVEDGAAVSLEFLDDVAVHWPDGQVTLEQCKHSTGSVRFTDKSVELWKTFANWANICKDRKLDPEKTRFVLYATPGIASQLTHDLDGAKTDEAANAIIAKIKKWLTPATVEKGVGPHVSHFVDHGDEVCRAIIRNFSFAAEPDPVGAIQKILRATLPNTAVEDFAKAAIGMAKESAEVNMRNRISPVVDAKAFRAHFHAFVRKYNLAGLLNSTTGDPDQAEINRTIQSSPTYVRQLNSVALSPEIIVGAVAAYLRTTADRVKWAEDGEIVESSLDDFDQGLERKFILLRDEVEDVHSTKEEKERGRMIYRGCSGVLLPLEDRTVPSYFVEGAYNILANDVRVGWHPSYKKLMGKG